jgi:UDP-N-acetylmuramoyl-tripeptide--D-alanyl-D-alanine ligase
MTKTEKNTLIIDAYNANPTSMRASVGNFDTLNFEGKVVVLGDMRELGEDSLKEHKEFVEWLADIKVERTILVGEEFKKAVEALENGGSSAVSKIPLALFDDSALLREHFANEPLEGKTILIKGSRGIKLERIFDVL